MKTEMKIKIRYEVSKFSFKVFLQSLKVTIAYRTSKRILCAFYICLKKKSAIQTLNFSMT